MTPSIDVQNIISKTGHGGNSRHFMVGITDIMGTGIVHVGKNFKILRH